MRDINNVKINLLKINALLLNTITGNTYYINRSSNYNGNVNFLINNSGKLIMQEDDNGRYMGSGVVIIDRDFFHHITKLMKLISFYQKVDFVLNEDEHYTGITFDTGLKIKDYFTKKSVKINKPLFSRQIISQSANKCENFITDQYLRLFNNSDYSEILKKKKKKAKKEKENLLTIPNKWKRAIETPYTYQEPATVFFNEPLQAVEPF